MINPHTTETADASLNQTFEPMRVAHAGWRGLKGKTRRARPNLAGQLALSQQRQRQTLRAPSAASPSTISRRTAEVRADRQRQAATCHRSLAVDGGAATIDGAAPRRHGVRIVPTPVEEFHGRISRL